MKWRFLLAPLALFLVVYSFSSCTKSNSPTIVHDTLTIIHKDTVVKIDTLVLTNPRNPIVGLWVGTYTIDAAPSAGSFFDGWSIFPDHSIIQQGGGTNGVVWTAAGTWSLAADSTFSCDIHSVDVTQGNVTEHITAKYSASQGTLSNGHWTYTNGTGQTGSFTLKRVGNQ